MLDTAVAREIYGPAAIYVRQSDPGLVGNALERALFDPAERSRAARGVRRCARPLLVGGVRAPYAPDPARMRALDVPRLSIVIVSYNSRGDLDACLASLTRNRPSVDHEIVVVDNASPDGTAAAIRARWPAVRVLDAGGNLGFAAANNIGIRQTFGELVLLLNPDTIVPPGAVDHVGRRPRPTS